MKFVGTTAKSMTTTSELCTLVDLMEDLVDTSQENILVSSNDVDKDNIRPGGLAWSSSKDDISPTITVTLSKTENIPLIEITLDKSDNVDSFTVTVDDKDGSTVYQTVSMPFYISSPVLRHL